MTASEEILARYARVEKEADAFGRIIAVKRLKPAQMMALKEMTPNLNGFTEIDDGKGGKVKVPDRFDLIVVASVISIDGDPVPFPRNRAEIDRVHNGLDSEGLEAAAKAFVRLHESADGQPIDAIATAKNL